MWKSKSVENFINLGHMLIFNAGKWFNFDSWLMWLFVLFSKPVMAYENWQKSSHEAHEKAILSFVTTCVRSGLTRHVRHHQAAQSHFSIPIAKQFFNVKWSKACSEFFYLIFSVSYVTLQAGHTSVRFESWRETSIKKLILLFFTSYTSNALQSHRNCEKKNNQLIFFQVSHF